MAKVNFTAGRVADFECEASKSQSFLWDTAAPGLGLRVTPTGAKAYIFQAKLNNQAIRITIGSPAIWDLDKARTEARRLQMLIDGGEDPRQVKAKAIEAKQAEIETKKAAKAAAEVLALKHTTTFKDVWDVYLAERKPHWGERHYQDHVKKIEAGGRLSKKGTRGRGVTIAAPLHYFANMPISSIDSEIVEKWAKLEGQKRPTSARLAWRMLKVFFQWCYESKAYRDLIPPQNPGKTKKSGESLGKAKPKRDNLEIAQLPGWFHAVKKNK